MNATLLDPATATSNALSSLLLPILINSDSFFLLICFSIDSQFFFFQFRLDLRFGNANESKTNSQRIFTLFKVSSGSYSLVHLLSLLPFKDKVKENERMFGSLTYLVLN